MKQTKTKYNYYTGGWLIYLINFCIRSVKKPSPVIHTVS